MAWFSCLARHPARKRSRSILTTPEPAQSMNIRTSSHEDFSILMVTCVVPCDLEITAYFAFTAIICLLMQFMCELHCSP